MLTACPWLQVLGDRSLKFKYLNPNTLFVAVGPPDGVPSAALPPDALQLTVSIIDTVTGRPLFRQTHQVRLSCGISYNN